MADSSTALFYRVDRRTLKLGERIMPTGDYLSSIDTAGQKLERLLSERRPSAKPERGQSLFLFETEVAARTFWSRMQNGKLYEVSIDQGQASHRGDMSWIDYARRFLSVTTKSEQAVDCYWSGAACLENAQYEVLVTHATVVRVVSTDEEERRAEFMKQSGWSFKDG